jgi:hypothetical protein
MMWAKGAQPVAEQQPIAAGDTSFATAPTLRPAAADPAPTPRAAGGRSATPLPAEDLADPELPPDAATHYELLALLGAGGMGVVYKARDQRLDRLVAIKFLRGGDTQLAARLLQEARAQAHISHPGVCPVYEVGARAGRPYIVMQLIDGQPFHVAMPQLSLDERIRVVAQVAEALHAAHVQGIIHRALLLPSSRARSSFRCVAARAENPRRLVAQWHCMKIECLNTYRLPQSPRFRPMPSESCMIRSPPSASPCIHIGSPSAQPERL